MSEYLSGLIVISALVGISSYVSYSDDKDKILRTATSLLVVGVIITPIITVVREAEKIEMEGASLEEYLTDIDDSEYGKSVKQAFEEGVKKFVCQTFSLNASDVRVVALNFDALTMKAEKIKVILYGSAAYADARSIAYEISSAELGKCEVEIGDKQAG